MKKLSLKELGRPDLETYKLQSKLPVLLVLDNIRSGMNVGSAFRTADAFAIDKIYLCGITAKPPHREILKTAIGATEAVRWEYHQSAADLLLHLKSEGYEIILVEQTDRSELLHNFSFKKFKKIAIVFGNEVKGIQDQIIKQYDYSIEIPQFGTKHSFNVSVSIGIVLWEIWRQVGKFKV